MSFSTPVALLIFNRPDTTEKVFEAIRQAKPSKLLVVADGPRASKPGEADKCAAARAIINRVDWDCQVLTNFSEVNLGCKNRVASGLDWVFSEVEDAIILEDDCIPAQSFFPFCQALLDYYRHDDRIMHIAGTNVQPVMRTNYSYYFSKYNTYWGWATWRRAWKYFDIEMKRWEEIKKLDLLDSICDDPYEKIFWLDTFDKVYSDSINSWAYRWTYSCWFQNGLSIIPNTNLVSNIGFGPGATHTKIHTSYANLPTYDADTETINHPPFVVRHYLADNYTFDRVNGGAYMKKYSPFVSMVRLKLSPIKRRIFSLIGD
jgi:hypothetical protein